MHILAYGPCPDMGHTYCFQAQAPCPEAADMHRRTANQKSIFHSLSLFTGIHDTLPVASHNFETLNTEYGQNKSAGKVHRFLLGKMMF